MPGQVLPAGAAMVEAAKQPTAPVTMTGRDAANYLHRVGQISSPDYWIVQLGNVPHLDELMVKFAKAVK